MFRSFFWKKRLVRWGVAARLPSVRLLLNGAERFLHYLNDRALAIPLDQLRDPAWFPDIQIPDSINLAMGAPRCDLPIGWPRSDPERSNLRATGSAELCAEIAARTRLEQGVAWRADSEVLITHGASGAFAAVIDTFLEPGSPVVLFDPASPLFHLMLLHRRARLRWLPSWMEEGKMRFDIEQFSRAMRGAKLLVLADPVNPTGAVLAPEDVEQIGWWAKKNDVLIYLDESYSGFRYNGEATHLAALPHTQKRLLTVGTVSKSFGLHNARVGWLLGDKNLLAPVAATAAFNSPFVSPFCQQIALSALQRGDSAAAALREEYAGRRRYLFESLQGMGLPTALPAGGFFFWVPINHLGFTGAQFARELLIAKKVLVNPGEPFGPSGRHYIRLSFATEEGRLREGLQRLWEFMETNRRQAVSAVLPSAPLPAPVPQTPLSESFSLPPIAADNGGAIRTLDVP